MTLWGSLCPCSLPDVLRKKAGQRSIQRTEGGHDVWSQPLTLDGHYFFVCGGGVWGWHGQSQGHVSQAGLKLNI